jgi:hypothetical protein
MLLQETEVNHKILGPSEIVAESVDTCFGIPFCHLFSSTNENHDEPQAE